MSCVVRGLPKKAHLQLWMGRNLELTALLFISPRRVKIYEVGASLLVQGVRLVSLFVVTGRVALEGRPRCGSILSVSTSIVHSRRWPW
jgi:hypothetical protein